MTVANILLTGAGALGMSAHIEGTVPEFCNCVQIAGTTSPVDGVTRVVGLDASGVRLQEEPDFIEGRLKASSVTLSLVGPEADELFGMRPQKVTTLTTDVPESAIATNVQVLSTAGFAADDVIHVNTEAMLVVAVVDSTNLTVERAYLNTILQAHYAGGTAGLRRPKVTDRPILLEGRRVRLYWYGDAEIDAGTATQFWIGNLSSEAKLGDDGLTWTLKAKNVCELLNQDLGSDLGGEVYPRGIGYNDLNRITGIITMGADATHTSATAQSIPISFPQTVHTDLSHYETQDDFLAAFNAYLNTLTTDWAPGTWLNNRVRAVTRPGGGWGFNVEIGGTAARWFSVYLDGRIDGSTIGGWVLDPDTDFAVTTTVAVNNTYEVVWAPGGSAGARMVPRGSLFHNRDDPSALGRAVSWNTKWLAVGGDLDLSTITRVRLEWAGGETTTHAVDAVDTTNRFIHLDPVDIWARWREVTFRPFFAEAVPRVVPTRTYVTSGDVSDFLALLVSLAPGQANRGSVPFITDTDIDTADIAAVCLRAHRGAPLYASRAYFHTGPVKLDDYLAEEFKSIGVVPCLAADGRITVRLMELRAPTDAAVSNLVEADPDVAAVNGTILDDRGKPQWERNALGMVNVVVVRTGYDPVSREHIGREYRIINPTGIGARKAMKVLEIGPYSAVRGIAPEDVTVAMAEMAERVFAVFGGEYETVTIEVPLTEFDLLVGDNVLLTSSLIMNRDTGGRGIEEEQAVVLWRDWEPNAGSGVLTLYMHRQRIAGYAPALRITGETNVSGNIWDLNVSTSFLEPGDIISNHFVVGERIQVTKFDDATPGTVQGKIDAVTEPDTIRVSLDGAATLNVGTWDLETADANHASLVTRQKRYAFLADSAGRINFASGVAAAQTFAPG